MKLYLHIGTEKTGSSFLQTTAARNRQLLLKQKIYFPTAGKREKDMMEGRISPGNGRPLFQAIKKGQLELAQQLLNDHRNDAAKEKCEAVLISNENLVELSLEKDGVAQLIKAISIAGFDSVEWLLVIREPVDQAISLYKHRAKSGNIKAPDNWIQKNYFTLDSIQHFYTLAIELNLSVTFRKYFKDSSKMVKLFFNDWLGIEKQLQINDEIINPSLTFSELLFLKSQFNVNPFLISPYYEALLRLPHSKKTDDIELENQVREVFKQKLIRFNEFIKILNAQMLESEQLMKIDETIQMTDLSTIKYQMKFSEDQISTLILTQHQLYSISGQTKTTLNSFKIKIAKYLNLLKKLS